MTETRRRLLSLGLVLVVVIAGVVFYRVGSDNEAQPPAQQSDVSLGNPDLGAVKAKAGIRDCAPGAGGGSLPAVTLSCLGGGTPVDLASLRGPMLVSFWFAGCEPCRKEMPVLEAFDQHFGDRVPVLGVDFLDQYPGSALELMQQTGATYPSVADPTGDLQAYAPFARMTGLPWLFFIDAQGRIAFQHPGAVSSESELTGLVRDHLGVDP